MREIKSPNVTQKRTDNSEKYLIQLIDDGKPTLLDQSVNYLAFITCDGSLVTPAGIELTIQDNQLVLDSAKLDLPAGIYHFEIWAEKDGQRAIYPDSGMKRLVINANATDLPNGTVTSLTLDEFVKEFKNLVKDVGNSSNPNQGGSIEASIDTDKRTITINGKSLTIPEPIDLSGLASKNDLAGLVKQTELAEYVKKNDLPNMPSLTDYVKKEELPKQPDLTKYALKSDLPDLTGYAKMSDLPSITDLVKKSELANYAKKSDLPVIPDLTPFLKTADADKKFATKSEIPSLDSYATKADLKTVTSNTTRHAPTGWTLDRTTNPWTIWFDNGCGIQYPSYYNNPVIYGQGNIEANVGNDLSRSCPHKTMIRISNGSFLPYKYTNREIEVFANYDKNIKVINPIRTDADKFDWSRCYGNKNTKSDGTFDEELLQKKTQFARAVYEVGIWSEEDLKPFGLVKK